MINCQSSFDMNHLEFERLLQNSTFKPTKQTPSDILENINFCFEKRPGRPTDELRSENSGVKKFKFKITLSYWKINYMLRKMFKMITFPLRCIHASMAVDVTTMKMIIVSTRSRKYFFKNIECICVCEASYGQG